MENTTKHQGKIIDQLRKDRKVSRQDLVEGIMSIRNFQRYASGESAMPLDKLGLLIDRLSLNYFEVSRYINNELNDDILRFSQSFDLFRKRMFDESLIKLYAIDKDKLSSSASLQMYNYIELECLYAKKEIDKEYFESELIKLINYPRILSFKVINVIELNSLISLNSLLSRKKETDILNFLIKIISRQSYTIFGWDRYKAPFIYASIAKSFYNIGQYEQCIDACNKGIEDGKDNDFVSALINLYSYKSFALHKLLKKDQAIDNALKAYMHLILEDNKNKRAQIKDIINRVLDIKIEEFIQLKREL